MSLDVGSLDDIIGRLRETKTERNSKQSPLTELEIRQLCHDAKDVFLKKPNLLKLKALIKICGDLHGQFSNLLRLFEDGGFPPESNYLLLGDYVDYGQQRVETICLLLVYKLNFKMSANASSKCGYGKHSLTALNACRWLH